MAGDRVDRIVAVAGATGFVGRHIVRELLGRGIAVRGLVRSREKARETLPRSEHLKLVVGEPSDPDAAAGLTAGTWGVVNAVGILRESADNSFRKAHVLATRALVDAAEAGGLERFVQVSALGVGDEGTTGYQKTKYEAEQCVRRSSLGWTILRPSLIHGADGEMMKMAKGWVTGEKQPWFFLPYFTRTEIVSPDVPLGPVRRLPAKLQPVAVEDVAWAAAEALERPEAAGEVFNLVGPETLTWPQLLETLQQVIPGADVALRPLGIPGEAASIQAKIAKIVGLGGFLPFDEGMPIMGSQDSTAGPDKARELLGFEARPFTPAVRAYADRI